MKRDALIIGHGQPSEPAGAEADMRALARAVADLLPDWRIEGATLAAEGALSAALNRLNAPLVLPFFMAEGFFTRQVLPARLAALGAGHLPHLLPFGLWPETAALAVRILRDATDGAGWRMPDTRLLLAAHGSGRGPLAAEAARTVEARIAAGTDFADMRLGFIEELPFVADAARGLGPKAICLPLFVARWGHVRDDLPEALAEAGFEGRVLDPLGCQPEVPALIARALLSEALSRGAE